MDAKILAPKKGAASRSTATGKDPATAKQNATQKKTTDDESSAESEDSDNGQQGGATPTPYFVPVSKSAVITLSGLTVIPRISTEGEHEDVSDFLSRDDGRY